MLNLILLLCIVLLLLPLSMKQTLKKVFPFLLAGIAVIFMVYGIENSSRLSIRALNEKNDFSEGTEVHIKEIWVNGEKVDFLHEYEGIWIEEESQLVWRSYDQIEGMTDEIQIELPKQAEVKIVFEKNKWRGKAFVNSRGYQEWIDCYEETGDSKSYVVEFVIEKGNVELYLKYGLLIFILILGMINVFFYFYRRRKGIDSFRKKEHEIWMDILKIVSAMMIVLIHSSGSIYRNCFGEEKWVAALVINAIPRFAVPCFFMISGIVLLPKKYDMEQVKNKIIRLMIPLGCFSVLAILLNTVGRRRCNKRYIASSISEGGWRYVVCLSVNMDLSQFADSHEIISKFFLSGKGIFYRGHFSAAKCYELYYFIVFFAGGFDIYFY